MSLKGPPLSISFLPRAGGWTQALCVSENVLCCEATSRPLLMPLVPHQTPLVLSFPITSHCIPPPPSTERDWLLKQNSFVWWKSVSQEGLSQALPGHPFLAISLIHLKCLFPPTNSSGSQGGGRCPARGKGRGTSTCFLAVGHASHALGHPPISP